MINKKNLWFLTLFSLVLVLSIYYVTMPNELLVTSNSNTVTETSITEEDVISALKMEDDNSVLEEENTLKEKITNTEATAEEKNSAFEELKKLNSNSSKEATLEEKIQNDFKLDSFIKIDDDQIRVVVGSSEHSVELANNIMRSIQEEFSDKMYISVQFKVS